MRLQSDSPEPLSLADVLEEEFACLHAVPYRFFECDWSEPYYMATCLHEIVSQLPRGTLFQWTTEDLDKLRVASATDLGRILKLLADQTESAAMKGPARQLLNSDFVRALTKLSEALTATLEEPALSSVVIGLHQASFKKNLVRNNRWLLEIVFGDLIKPRALSADRSDHAEWVCRWWDFPDMDGMTRKLRDVLPDYAERMKTKSLQSKIKAFTARSEKSALLDVINDALHNEHLYVRLSAYEHAWIGRFNRAIMDCCFGQYQLKGPAHEASQERPAEYPAQDKNGHAMSRKDVGDNRLGLIEELRRELIYRRIHELARNESATLENFEKEKAIAAAQSNQEIGSGQATDTEPSCVKEYAGAPRAALCLSGGGIRSATYSLGILQALSQFDVMRHFHYLSTVSGGGYIGSWLTAWIHRAGQQHVFECLARFAVPSSSLIHKPIDHLRQYSNYLTPRVGLLSGDTWAAVGIIIRNLLLNWLVLIPVLLAAVAIPILFYRLYGAYEIPAKENAISSLYLFIGMAWFAIAIFYSHAHRPGLNGSMTGFLRSWNQHHAFSLGLTAIVAGSVCIALSLVMESLGQWSEETIGAAFSMGLSLMWLGAAVLLRQKGQQFFLFALIPVTVGSFYVTLSLVSGNVIAVAPRWLIVVSFAIGHFLVWFPIAVVLGRTSGLPALYEAVIVTLSGAFGGVLITLFAGLSKSFFSAQVALDGMDQRILYTVVATPSILVIFLTAAVLYIGLATPYTRDQDREWWGRAGGWMLLVLTMWLILCALVLIAPQLLYDHMPSLTLAGIISGAFTLARGFSSKSKVDKDEEGYVPYLGIPWKMLISVITTVFVASLIVFFTFAFVWLFLPDGHACSWKPLCRIQNTKMYSIGQLAASITTLVLVSFIAAFYVDVNKYSLHSLYRNRLIRAYLGASNHNRTPDPFTNFDDADNVPLAGMKPAAPFHVINAALNLVAGDNLAWQERKASSFTFTPLHCGNKDLGYRPSKVYGTDDQGNSVSLGTAVAISGAAASPNMGYHSSPTITFLLTLFNVRLGWWMGNVRMSNARKYLRFVRARQNMTSPVYSHSSPAWSFKPLLAEAFGWTNEDRDYINLSDGGHFENLGLYEMVNRRCHHILVIDAGCDEKCSFEDLGNAIRKIRIDLGISISIKATRILPRSRPGVGKLIAAGEILYSDIDEHAPNGYLFYIKPAIYNETEPMDIYSYGQASESFPHESTAKQWFSESQFESYRMLGYSTLQELGASPPPKSLNAFFNNLRARA